MDSILKLKDLTPLTHGKSRYVFEHPDDPDLLVKVIIPEVIDKRFGEKTKWYKKRRRYGKFVSYMREIQEFIAVHESTDTSPHFLQRIIGFCRTDLGLGLIVQAVRTTEGKLAPPLATLIREESFNAAAQQALQTLLDQLLASNVVISDLNLGNMVYTQDDEHGNYFVLIDGLGNNAFLPLKVISSYFNRRSKLGRFEKLRNRIEKAKRANAARKAANPPTA